MPLKELEGALLPNGVPRQILRCINHATHGDRGDESTMMRHVGWNALTEVDPPTSKMTGVMFNPGAGVPVGVFYCKICGYVELYAGSVIDKVWNQ